LLVGMGQINEAECCSRKLERTAGRELRLRIFLEDTSVARTGVREATGAQSPAKSQRGHMYFRKPMHQTEYSLLLALGILGDGKHRPCKVVLMQAISSPYAAQRSPPSILHVRAQKRAIFYTGKHSAQRALYLYCRAPRNAALVPGNS
jgi:hypothetical protein